MSSTTKGFFIGLVITFILILISSFNAPRHNYNKEVEQYDMYTFIVQNCSNNPSDSCLIDKCVARGFDALSCSHYPEQWHNNREIKAFSSGEKPHISTLITPNIKDGLESYLMSGIFGIFILLLPIILGLLIGGLRKKN